VDSLHAATSEAVVTGSLAGGLATMFLGVIVGLFQWRPLAGAMWGAVTGLVIGACAGPILYLPQDRLPALLGTVGMGSLVLVGAGALIRYWSRT
jgi:hypothetical protein